MLYHVLLSLCDVGGWYSQRLLGLNPTTVMVVLLLGLSLVLGCDNNATCVAPTDQLKLVLAQLSLLVGAECGNSLKTQFKGNLVA